MKHIFKCSKCDKYTMKEVCSCGSKTVTCKPVKYSPEDNFAEWRRKAKIELLKEK